MSFLDVCFCINSTFMSIRPDKAVFPTGSRASERESRLILAARLFGIETEFFDRGGEILPRVLGAHFLVDLFDDPLLVDVEGPAFGVGSSLVDDAVSLGGFFAGVAEDGIIEVERFGEFLVRFGGVDARGEIRDVERFQCLAVLTERLAFGRSAARERLGKPGDHDPFLALELRQLVGFAVGPGKRPVGRFVADFKLLGGARASRGQHRAEAADRQGLPNRDCQDMSPCQHNDISIAASRRPRTEGFGAIQSTIAGANRLDKLASDLDSTARSQVRSTSAGSACIFDDDRSRFVDS